MDRHLRKVTGQPEVRRTIGLPEIRELSRQADEYGLARFVLTGGEPLVMRNPTFEEVVEAVDPQKHYVITDTNGWFMDYEKAKHLKSIGVEKVQLSLDSYIEQEHDTFRNKPGSHKRAMRAIDACLDAEINIILSTCLIRGRAGTKEFRDLCAFSQKRGVGLYVTYAKPVGSCKNHLDWIITKEDADVLKELEKSYSVFTHMTPSYGMFQGCITVKGIITVTSTGEIIPCPYMDMSIGNYLKEPLKVILERGMRNKWLGSHRPDCLIGEDLEFIKFHNDKVEGRKLLPVPYGKGFSDADLLPVVH
jgi:MoaA/NifB/PqqE/SkfB family radical SAM enzyme